jgi:hypothetical protein
LPPREEWSVSSVGPVGASASLMRDRESHGRGPHLRLGRYVPSTSYPRPKTDCCAARSGNGKTGCLCSVHRRVRHAAHTSVGDPCTPRTAILGRWVLGHRSYSLCARRAGLLPCSFRLVATRSKSRSSQRSMQRRLEDSCACPEPDRHVHGARSTRRRHDSRKPRHFITVEWTGA